MKTSLYDEHVRLKARIVDYAGYQMPLDYGSSISEHRSVRHAAGLFDVSHMGVLPVTGPEAGDFLARVLTNDPRPLAVGQILYSPLLDEDGAALDDLLVYRMGPDSYRLVVNAGNRQVDFEHLKKHAGPGAGLAGDFAPIAILALQGPVSERIVKMIFGEDLLLPGNYRFVQTQDSDGTQILISRTGYTGEDGFELFLPAASAPELWRKLLDVGSPLGLVPAGLAARDSLRMEAGLPLYGHELSRERTALDAGLARFVNLDREGFFGREALLAQRAAGQVRSRLALIATGRGLPRAGDQVFDGETRIGYVTSGGYSPTLDAGIALVSAEPGLRYAEGHELTIQGTRRPLAARVCPRPHYRRSRGG
ncbi:MAG: glycine cleavage system aminomethyltransferase GcvT [Bacillota bacterium]|nr:glycine cleavage system aminomethyltransferase GcvT [Bacillota bacterium]